MRSLRNAGAVCVMLVTVVATVGADTTYLASSLYTLYRVTPERELESWEMDVKLRGMHCDPASDTVYVLGDQGSGTPATVYILENAVSGTPSLTAYADLAQFYGSFTAIGSTFYGFKTGSLYAIDLSDPGNPIETLIGTTGINGTAGAAYNPVKETLYMLSRNEDALFTVDPETADSTFVTDVDVNALDFGAEWFDGQLYAAVRNGDSDALEIGTIDVFDGSYKAMFSLPDNEGATALAVIPEPAAAALMLVPCFLLARRRN